MNILCKKCIGESAAVFCNLDVQHVQCTYLRPNIPPKSLYTIYAFVLGNGSEFYRLKSILRSCTSKNRGTLICDVNHNGLRIYEVAFIFLLYFYKNLQFLVG